MKSRSKKPVRTKRYGRARTFRPLTESNAMLLDDEFDYEIEGFVIGQPAVLEDESK